MALEEAIRFQDIYSYSNNNRDVYNIFGGNDNNWMNSDFDLLQTEEKLGSLDIVKAEAKTFMDNSTHGHLSHLVAPQMEQWGCNSSSETAKMEAPQEFTPSETSTTMSCRTKRRRSRSQKNMMDIENQRMTHIAVERNRRKQMNEYLSLLRSLMPDSYVQRVDQASIVGGAINYVKDLEHQLQFLSGHHTNQSCEPNTSSSSSPFTKFFVFPQYSTHSSNTGTATNDNPWANANQSSAMADIEVTMVESHANMKIRSKSRPKQLPKLVNELQILRLTILHLISVNTDDQIVLYSLCVKVEDDCKFNSGEEIATAVKQILATIQMEGSFFLK